ncbi:tail fiber protein [Marichromatium sp. PS1]|uniref:phage tail protein n=1 Tax=Marichromatium sp. PS1 TaxID=3138932 RepID=UPI0032E7C62A
MQEAVMVDPFIGEIALFGFNYAPRDFSLCEGQMMSPAQNSALFSLLSNYYGGNGQTTFALPDLRGRAPVGFGAGSGLTLLPIGQQAGSEDVFLGIANLPSGYPQVEVAIPAQSGDGGEGAPGPNRVLAKTAGVAGLTAIDARTYSTGTADTTLKPFTATATQPGGGQAVPVRGPCLAINFSIALDGTYPPRS